MRGKSAMNTSSFGSRNVVFSLSAAMKPFLLYRSVLNRILKEMAILQDPWYLERTQENGTIHVTLDDLNKKAIKMKEIMSAFDRNAARVQTGTKWPEG
ncbi:hypothetical protein WG66_002498 [Moniliophthora roreri]|nr:hypothetical protein WG66_002498 [Moniliophthora roreri]